MLLAHMDMGKVTEYETATMKILWTTVANRTNTWSAIRLENGNTVFVNWNSPPSVPRIFEVDPDKRLIWSLKTLVQTAVNPKLGPATSIQLLDEPGAMENGDVQH